MIVPLVNGIIIAYSNVTPFITFTLGTMIIACGINSYYMTLVNGASPISGFDSGFPVPLRAGFVAMCVLSALIHHLYALIAVAFVCA